MHPAKSAYSEQPSLIHQIQPGTDTRPEEHDNHNGFCPKTLRLSRSFPSNPDSHRSSSRSLSVHRWKEGLARASHSHLLLTPEHQPGYDDTQTHRPSDQLIPQIPPRPCSQRLRTRSLDRKPKSILHFHPSSTHQQNSHPLTNSCRRRPSLIDSSSTDSSSLSSSPPNESTQRHQAGFHSHIPIERTVLSVLPTSRRPSIDWTGAGPTGASSAANDSWQSNPSMTSSGSPQSTLATSVDSSGTPPRPRYQPRPLLLSAFGNNNVRRTSLDPSSSSSLARTRGPSRETVMEQESLTNRRLAEARIEKVQQVRQERFHAREAKKLRKRAREAELEALSSSVSQGKLGVVKPIPEADEDDCWSWVSSSDAAAEEESEEELEPEEMAVVWRASLDVGRRVSKDRKALGRGHGIRLSPRALEPRPSSSRSLVPSPPTSSFQTLSPLHFLRLAFRKRHLLTNPLRASPLGPFIFGAGLLSGIFCSVLCSSLAGRIPSSLQRRFLLPLSSTGIGLFFNLVFPSASTVPSPALGFLHPGTIGTSFGLCAQWS